MSKMDIWCRLKGPNRRLPVTGCRRAVQYMQITLQHELQFCVTVTMVTSDNGHIRHSPSRLICTLPTQHPPYFSWRRGGCLARQDVGWQVTMPFPFQHGAPLTEVSGWKNSIRLSPQSLTEDKHPQPIAICNLHPAVSQCLNVSLYQPV